MKKIAFIHFDEAFQKQIQYVIGTIFEPYKIKVQVMSKTTFQRQQEQFDLVISYGEEALFPAAKLHLWKGNLFNKDYLTAKSIPQEIEFYDGLPVFFKDNRQSYFYRSDLEKVYINTDFIQTTFYLLSCYEEHVLKEYDAYGRFNVENSLVYRYNLLNRPIINEYVEWFITLLNNLMNTKIEKKQLWDDRKFAVLLSHDVDVITKYLSFLREIRLQLSILLVNKKPQEVWHRIKGYIDTKVRRKLEDPCDTFDYILDMERERGYQSSFYFMGDGKGYNINHRKVQRIVEKILAQGHEVGFHPGLGTSNNEKIFNKELKKVQKALKQGEKVGVRQHYLSFHASTTWRIQQKHGVHYDTTVCYPQQAGFKVGYCLPYQPYDLEENRKINIWEIPLIVMEGSLLQYMKLDLEQSIAYIKDLIAKIEKHNGVFVLLWHNSSISSEYNQYSKDIFCWVYDYINHLNCIVNNGRNIISKYEKNIWEDEYGIHTGA